MFEIIKRFAKFNIFKILKVNHTFRKQNLNIKDIHIFWDLDNTIYLFSEYGKDKEALEKSMEEGYYYNIPIFPGAAAFLRFLYSLCPNLWILSKYPRVGADLEKLESIKRDMPWFPEDHILLIPLEQDKGEIIRKVCDPTKAIIVDDYHENIITAYNQGIVGVKKTFSGKVRPIYQIKEFYELIFILKKLNVKFDVGSFKKKTPSSHN
jgi:hypothetical protein